jgi:sugar/nucleoside kinase (ribokinase family)
MSDKITVSGIGCCLVDLLFNDIDFGSDVIRPYLSGKRGDGGLTPGHLVFREEFEKFSGDSFDLVLSRITRGKSHDKVNIGGPSIVSLIHAAQMVDKQKCEVRFYGRGGKDDIGDYLLSSLKKTPVVLKDYRLLSGRGTPSTVVLSDPSYDNGHGERMFINSIAAAWDYNPDELHDDFFDSDIVVFGGTALVPQIHDHMTTLLKRAKSRGCITIVNTVFDFRNEKADPTKKWPMGESDESYRYIDLLITDREEALRLSGMADQKSALGFFRDNEVSSLIITNGSKDILTYSDGRFFGKAGIAEMPVSQKVNEDLKKNPGGDTTGCGDNFVGGVIASVVDQLQHDATHPDLKEACCRGIVSGGYTCFYMGGTYFEKESGEKKARIEPYYDAYLKQVAGR